MNQLALGNVSKKTVDGLVFISLLLLFGLMFAFDALGFKLNKNEVLSVSIKCLKVSGTVILSSSEQDYVLAKKDRGCNGFSSTLSGEDLTIYSSNRHVIYKLEKNGVIVFNVSLQIFTLPLSMLVFFLYIFIRKKLSKSIIK